MSEGIGTDDNAINDGGITFAVQSTRVVARVMGAVLVGAVALAVLFLVYRLPGVEPPVGDARGTALLYRWFAAAVAVGWVYEIVSLTWRGTTLGKWAVGVEVIAPDARVRPGLVSSMRRSSRQILLWIVVPLGLQWVWRLLLLERRQAWYDRSSGAAVRWTISAGSRRRRMWERPESGPGAWAKRHPAFVLSVGAGVMFCVFARPPTLREGSAVSAIELLVTANVVGIGVFVATAVASQIGCNSGWGVGSGGHVRRRLWWCGGVGVCGCGRVGGVGGGVR